MLAIFIAVLLMCSLVPIAWFFNKLCKTSVTRYIEHYRQDPEWLNEFIDDWLYFTRGEIIRKVDFALKALESERRIAYPQDMVIDGHQHAKKLIVNRIIGDSEWDQVDESLDALFEERQDLFDLMIASPNKDNPSIH